MRQNTSDNNPRVNQRLNYQPLISVKRKLWRRDDEHADVHDEAFSKTREQILMRDNYTCFFCGFKSGKFQEIHHVDDNHQNNDEKNLITNCNLCHMVHHVGMVAMNDWGFISIIPEMTQTEINHICRNLFIVDKLPSIDERIKNKLTGLYASFQQRGTDTLKNVFGIDISSPFMLAEVLSTCPDEIFNKRGELLDPLRIVPKEAAFRAGQIEWYVAKAREQFDPKNWTPLTKQLLSVEN